MADFYSNLTKKYDSSNVMSGFTGTTNLRDYQIFQPNYYAGGDVSIYFGDVWVDEINMIQFSMQEHVLPIYGYADYVFNRTASGTRIVQGAFRVNFTEVGYIYSIVNKIAAVSPIVKIPTVIDRQQHIADNVFKPDGMSFDEYVEKCEQAVWGNRGASVASMQKPNISGSEFDIVITYGQHTDTSSGVQDGYSTPRSTVRIIKDVRLTGVQQMLDASDNVIMEEYTFIGRDLDNM